MPGKHADIGVAVIVAALACGAAAAGAPAAVTIALGVALFAAPGYLLGELLLGPAVAGLARVAVVCALTLAVPILGGLLLSAAGVALDRAAWLGLLSGVTLVAGLLLFARRRSGRAAALRWRSRKSPLTPRQIAAFGTAAVIAACGLALAWVAAVVQPTPGFTALSLSARGERAPTANLEVRNEQGATTRYRLVLLRAGRVSAAWSFTLANGESWRRVVPCAARDALAANLYRLPDFTRPYRHVATAGAGAAGS
jgi:hypothetical protein